MLGEAWNIRLAIVFGVVGLIGTAISLSARPAWGQDSNYRDHLVGQRAVGLGGAFTAIATDPSAGFYNPAGFVLSGDFQLGLSLAAAGVEYRQIPKGLSRSQFNADLSRWEFMVFPALAGAMFRFGPKDKQGRRVWGAGFTIATPDLSKIQFYTGLAGQEGDNGRRTVLFLRRENRRFMAGPSIARRFGNFSIGLAAFYVHRTLDWTVTDSDVLSNCDALPCTTQEANSLVSRVNGYSGSLNFRLGMMYRVHPKVQLGLMASFASIPLWNYGEFLLQEFRLPQDKTQPSTHRFSQEKGLKVNSPLPWEFRLGVAFRPLKRLLLSLDIAYYPAMEYLLVRIPESARFFQFPGNVIRNHIANVSLGVEFYATANIPLRFGFFTNLSSAPDIPELTDDPYLPQVHMFGGTASVGLRFWGLRFDLGLSIAYGGGSAQRLRFDQSPAYERVPMMQLYMHVYLAGATKFLGETLKQLWKQVRTIPAVRQVEQQIKPNQREKTPKNRRKVPPPPRRRE